MLPRTQKFQSVVPVLKVTDLQRAVEFYSNVLGFSVAWQAANDGGGENAMLVAGDTSVLLSTGTHPETNHSSPVRCIST